MSEADYVNAIKSTIAETASEYESDEVDELLLWEMIKLKIRDASMKYSKVKMKKMRNEETNIERALATLEGQLEQAIRRIKLKKKSQAAYCKSLYLPGEKSKEMD